MARPTRQSLPFPVYSRAGARARLQSAGYKDSEIYEITSYSSDYTKKPDPRSSLYKKITQLHHEGCTEIIFVTGPRVSELPRAGRYFLIGAKGGAANPGAIAASGELPNQIKLNI